MIRAHVAPKRAEITFYFGVYVAALIYSMWEIFKLSNGKHLKFTLKMLLWGGCI
jgi:hypothetical protein